jgi:hypothetical protein
MAGIEEKGQQEFDIEAVSAKWRSTTDGDGICDKTLLSSLNTKRCHLLRHKNFSYPNVCLRPSYI